MLKPILLDHDLHLCFRRGVRVSMKKNVWLIYSGREQPRVRISAHVVSIEQQRTQQGQLHHSTTSYKRREAISTGEFAVVDHGLRNVHRPHI